jgi:hypothetical protein
LKIGSGVTPFAEKGYLKDYLMFFWVGSINC